MITKERLNEIERENFMSGGYPETRELVRLAKLGLWAKDVIAVASSNENSQTFLGHFVRETMRQFTSAEAVAGGNNAVGDTGKVRGGGDQL